MISDCNGVDKLMPPLGYDLFFEACEVARVSGCSRLVLERFQFNAETTLQRLMSLSSRRNWILPRGHFISTGRAQVSRRDFFLPRMTSATLQTIVSVTLSGYVSSNRGVPISHLCSWPHPATLRKNMAMTTTYRTMFRAQRRKL